MFASVRYLSSLFLILIIFSSENSIGQNRAFASNKAVNCIPACARYNSSKAFYDIVKYTFVPDMSKGAIMLDELEVNPILAAGISVAKFTSSVWVVEPVSGQTEEIMGDIIEANSPYIDANGVIELEIEIRGVYTYNRVLYNGFSNPLVFACNLYGYTYDMSTEDFTGSIIWSAQYDPQTEVICDEEAVHKKFSQISGISAERAYPNPSFGVFKIQTEGKMLKELFLFNSSGQRMPLNSENLIQEIGDQGFKLDLSNYPDGMYFLSLGSAKGKEFVKLIKGN